jgi:hypothetical protein
MRLLGLVPLAMLLLSNAPGHHIPKLHRAPAQYVTTDWGMTVRTPPGSTYCPLPDDFEGSYHGPGLFLVSPGGCNGQTAPNISISNWPWSMDSAPPEPCHRVGSIRLFGKDRPLCRSRHDGMIAFNTSARFDPDGATQFDMWLETTPKRLNADLATFRTMAATARPCSAYVQATDWRDRKIGKPRRRGSGAPCPAGARNF